MRQVYGLDSRVGIVVLAKGRSPAMYIMTNFGSAFRNISRIGIILVTISPTRLNGADDHSRDREMLVPRGCPHFVFDMVEGRTGEWDARARLARQRCAEPPWAHLVERLLRPTALRPWSDLFAAR